jgi:hypothetical protein
MHQHVELPPAHRGPQCFKSFGLAVLVDRNEFDVGDMAEQLCFDATDHPGELSLGPGALQCAHDGERMTGIADGR